MRQNRLTILEKASFFDKNTLQRVLEISDNAVYANIKRWLKNGKIVQLKRGLYVTGTFWQHTSGNQAYAEFVANVLKSPSYLSLEYILQKYSVLTESVFAFTSVSLKKTAVYQNKLGVYKYSNIKKSLYTGYSVINKSGFEIREASKAKALFDFLYYKVGKMPQINPKLVASLRLNLSEFSQSDWSELDSYVKLAENKKISQIRKLLGPKD